MIIIGSVKWWFNIGKWLQRSLESQFFFAFQCVNKLVERNGES